MANVSSEVNPLQSNQMVIKDIDHYHADYEDIDEPQTVKNGLLTENTLGKQSGAMNVTYDSDNGEYELSDENGISIDNQSALNDLVSMASLLVSAFLCLQTLALASLF